jgi:hypothetical protein
MHGLSSLGSLLVCVCEKPRVSVQVAPRNVEIVLRPRSGRMAGILVVADHVARGIATLNSR